MVDVKALRELAERWLHNSRSKPWAKLAWEDCARELLALLAEPGDDVPARDHDGVLPSRPLRTAEEWAEAIYRAPCQLGVGVNISELCIAAHTMAIAEGVLLAAKRIAGHEPGDDALPELDPASEGRLFMRCVCAHGHDGPHLFAARDQPNARGGMLTPRCATYSRHEDNYRRAVDDALPALWRAAREEGYGVDGESVECWWVYERPDPQDDCPEHVMCVDIFDDGGVSCCQVPIDELHAVLTHYLRRNGSDR